jgi:hypothetical protein
MATRPRDRSMITAASSAFYPRDVERFLENLDFQDLAAEHPARATKLNFKPESTASRSKPYSMLATSLALLPLQGDRSLVLPPRVVKTLGPKSVRKSLYASICYSGARGSRTPDLLNAIQGLYKVVARHRSTPLYRRPKSRGVEKQVKMVASPRNQSKSPRRQCGSGFFCAQ